MIKKNLFILLTLVIFINSGVHAKESFVYLDMNLILNTSNVGQNIIEQLNNENNSIQKKIFETEKKLKKEEAELFKKKNILSKDEFDKILNSFNQKVLTHNADKKKNLDDLEKKKISSQEKIISIINPILQDYIEKESISLILKKESLIVAPKELNITDKIIQELNNKIKKLEL